MQVRRKFYLFMHWFFGGITEAIDAARSISRNQESELVIHRPNGQIRDRDSHGKDPFPPKG
ncbi:DUF2188 domain-containing protein [Klebsiella pneumoniae]|uniref:DUF2188 domain-containing protein n=1 Tax=Klebsiella pneumoniae TaxID=573 RepID=UPI0009838831|nr:DUF2188 domain-containing protein [Klebsiella pneumoniae]